jgi:hypothetical protein
VPYTAWDQVNPAIKGIKPRLTLAMANHVAAMADAIAKGDNPPDSPWAVAIATFYKEYKRSGGRWVKRKPKEATEMGALTDAMKATYDEELAARVEELTKKMGDQRHGADDFLVVEDPEKPSTWHLPVKVMGRPNRKLAGQAWAALISPGGFRGQKYEGPDPGGAKRKLRALYKAQGWEVPAGESAEAGMEENAWYPGGDESVPYVPGGAKSFADVEASQAAQEATERMHVVTYQFGSLAWNILNDDDETDKLGKLQGLTDEFLALAAEIMGTATPERTTPPVTPPETPPAGEVEPSEGTGSIPAEMSEAVFGHALRLVEDDPAISPPVSGSIVPMAVDVAFIEPGWGNEQDKHYYPAEVLKRDAHVFEGAKMYETDHRQQEKSTRTWVSTIREIAGFTETGAPVARVIVHDEDFAKRLKALSEAAMLEKMECSILALGAAKKGKVDGKEANIVERITEAQSVDWVTRAGAGGRALKLTEGESGMTVYRLTFKIKGEVKPANEAVLKALNGALGTVVEGAELADVVLAEVDEPVVAEPEADGEKPPVVVEPAAGEDKPPEGVTPPEDAVIPPEPEAVPALTAEATSAALEATNLPAAAKAKLMRVAGSYVTEASLKAAIGQETEYVKALTGSGKPFAQGPSSGPDIRKAMTEAEYATAMDGILGRHGVVS